MEYNIDFFINKFEAIPENNFIQYRWGNEKSRKHCALGHCRYYGIGGVADVPEANALYILIASFLDGLNVIRLNDSRTEIYQQPTPKQRILAALYDIKAQQNNVDAAKEIITKEFSKISI